MRTRQDYDSIVIGGGPAGATVSTLLARQGRRVLLLEKSQFPRHHIGESLMPHTYWTFQRLGMLEKLKASHFPRKESVQFVSATGKESQPFYFFDRDPNEWSITWQVHRGEFDRMMLDNARENGVDVREGVAVKEVLFDGSRARGVRARVDETWMEWHAPVTIDATGNIALISRQLNLRYPDARLKHAAIYAYWKGAYRDEGRNAGATIVAYTPDNNGWFWFIPLPDDITSVGVVAPPSYLCTARGDDPLATLEEEIANCPAAARRLTSATRVSHAYVTSDFSYRSRRVAGDGWLMVGDAFGFLDPIYSSGVMLALKSGEFAADAVHEALAAGDFSAEQLGGWAAQHAAGIQRVRQLVYAFYDKRFSFGEFIREYPQFHNDVVRVLIGDVFNSEVDEMFRVLGRVIDMPEPLELEQGVRSA
ncbi:MAG: tryptophan 7-halogenase [Planctomycetes bacterium]|nr:tryptophan 7-halogenase [Planctomycetota bacterium]